MACGVAIGGAFATAQDVQVPVVPEMPTRDEPLQSAGPPPIALVTEAPEIDGVLDEIWAAGTLLPDTWRQVLPDEGAPPSQRTEIFLMRDTRNLYIGVRCHDTDPDAIVARGLQRDTGIGADDHVVILIDPKRDRRTGYTFAMTPRAARYDARIVNGREDSDWDAIWDGRASMDENGWTAEFVIPFRTISIDAAATEWGFNAQRILRRNNETDRWAAADRDIPFNAVAEAGVVAMFGDRSGGGHRRPAVRQVLVGAGGGLVGERHGGRRRLLAGHAVADLRRHRQPGLRRDRGRSAGHQLLAVLDPISGEAGLLPRGRGVLQLRRHPLDARTVLLASHRPLTRRSAADDPRRGEADRLGW